MIIDGTSQPGYAGLPLIEINGSQAGSAADGLVITGGNSIVQGLIINGFQGSWSFDGSDQGGNAIVLQGQGGNTIEDDFLGTDSTGTSAVLDGQAGVFVDNSPGNTIGGTTAAVRNVIVTVFLEGSGATGNVVEGDYIDADATGTAYVAGTTNFYLPSGAGIVLETADANAIGGAQPGAGNVIGGGVDLLSGADGNVIEGNMIGTNASGTRRLAGWTGTDIATVGTLNFRDDSQYNTIGGSTAAVRNLIGGGVVLDSTALFDVVEGNDIGTDATGTAALYASSGAAGVMVSGQFDFIGGDSAGEGNLISGFPYGVEISGGNDIQVQGNLIGTDVTGTHALGNTLWGVEVDGGSDNTIGGSTPGAGNLISGNHEGIDVGGTDTVVEGNLVGTDITGTLPLGNAGDGVDVDGPGDSIGGTTPGSGNVISANGQFGIYIAGGGVSVDGNMIGTDLSGTLPLGNASDGINIQTENNQIGGPMPGAGNVIAANGGNGVSIVVPVLNDTGPGNVVQGNEIGTNSSGAKDLGNVGDGVYIMGSSYFPGDQTIGGTALGAGNVIAYNGGAGVLSDSGPGDSIRGNDIFGNGGLGIVAGINGVLSTYAEARGVALPDSCAGIDLGRL